MTMGIKTEQGAALRQPTGPGQPLPKDHPLAETHRETDQKVLETLLRMNLERSGDG